MSDVLYPLAAVESLDIQLVSRVITDDFEDGSTAARRLWNDRHFKRRFTLQHTALTDAEFQYLKSFAAARSGRYDAFWFRDNVHRTGNAKVRFGEDFRLNRQGMIYRPTISMEEIAPLRLLPDQDELAAAIDVGGTGLRPIFWYDANRIQIWLHAGQYDREPTLYDTSLNNRHLTPDSPSDLGVANLFAQYQHFTAIPARRICPDTSVGLSNLMIACFFNGSHSGVLAAVQDLAEAGAGKAAGLQIQTGVLSPYNGNLSETYTNAKWTVTTGWHSAMAFVGPGSVGLYVDGQRIGFDAKTNNASELTRISLLSDDDGANQYGGDINHVAAWWEDYGDIELVDLAAANFHNLFAYQFNLATI